MCKTNNNEPNQQVTQPPRNQDDQVIWDIPVDRNGRRILFQFPNYISFTEFNNILSAADRFDNHSASTTEFDQWSIPSTDTSLTNSDSTQV